MIGERLDDIYFFSLLAKGLYSSYFKIDGKIPEEREACLRSVTAESIASEHSTRTFQFKLEERDLIFTQNLHSVH